MTFTRRWFSIFTISVALLAGSSAIPVLGHIGLALAALAVILTVWDVRRLPDRGTFHVTREAPAKVQVCSNKPVQIELINQSPHPWRVLVHEEPPEKAQHDWSDVRVIAPAGQVLAMPYTFKVDERGEHRFGSVWLRIEGRFGLAARTLEYPLRTVVEAYLSLPSNMASALVLKRLKAVRTGGRISPLGGAGREFESLRDYVPDDDFRRIDWKATARRGRLTSREYQIERSQTVVLAVDLGRTMMATIEGRPKVEHALVAAMGLAQAAITCDDRVAVCLFDDRLRVWMPPRKGRMHLYGVTRAFHSAGTRRVEADYRTMVDYLKERCRTRSLVVLFTDIWDPDSSRVLREQLARLIPLHLVLCVTVTDTNVLTRAVREPMTVSEAYAAGVAQHMLEEQRAATRLLQGTGAMVLEASADRVSADLVSRYLMLKRRMQL